MTNRYAESVPVSMVQTHQFEQPGQRVPDGMREAACPDCGFYTDSFRPPCARCDSTGTVLARIPGYDRRRTDGTPADRASNVTRRSA